MNIPQTLILVLISVMIIFAVSSCDRTLIAGQYYEPFTECEESIETARTNCPLALKDWVENCAVFQGQCYCTGVIYLTCPDVVDITNYCGDCLKQALSAAILGRRDRERDALNNLSARFSGETLL